MEDLEITAEGRVKLEERQTELTKLIEAFVKLDKSREWQVVKELIFDRSLVSIERQLLSESLATEVKPDRLYKLQGEWAWSKQFADVSRFIQILTKQLEDIKIKLK